MGQGFGMVAPSEVSLNGDDTSWVEDLIWTSWGSSEAVGSGKATWVGPNQSDAQGTIQPATAVAFDLGTCGSGPAYTAFTWYFPGEGQTFNPGSYLNVCTGDRVGDWGSD